MHYWPPSEGPKSPLAPIFHEAAEAREDELEIFIVDNGFIHPQHTPDEMPLTVLYRNGEEVNSAPFDPAEIQELLERA